MSLPDITTRSDIDLILTQFYQQAMTDPTIGHFFTQVIALDLEHHLPVIGNFWDSILLGARNYRGNPMIKHIEMSRKAKMLPAHFDKWLALWESTVNQYFSGPVAGEAISRANQIAELMKHKIKMDEMLS